MLTSDKNLKRFKNMEDNLESWLFNHKHTMHSAEDRQIYLLTQYRVVDEDIEALWSFN